MADNVILNSIDMSKKTKLSNEHVNNLSEIRGILLSFIRNISDELDGTSFEKENIVHLFLKLATVLLKLIPIEHKVINDLNEDVLAEKDCSISKSEIEILKNFLDQNLDNNGY